MTNLRSFQKTANVFMYLSAACCIVPFITGVAFAAGILPAILVSWLAMAALYRLYRVLTLSAGNILGAVKKFSYKGRKAARKLYRTALYYEYKLNV